MATPRLACTGPYQVPPWTTAERLRHIEALARQINTYVAYVCQAEAANGASVEVREKAIADFYNRMVVLECDLCRIHQELQLA